MATPLRSAGQESAVGDEAISGLLGDSRGL